MSHLIGPSGRRRLLALGAIAVLAFLPLAGVFAYQYQEPTVPDQAFEQRWNDQIADGIVVGKLIRLNTRKREFFAIHSPAETNPQRRAVLMLHGMRGHPNWQSVIGPLRRALPERGWSTLSLQMPVLGIDTGMRDHSMLLNFSPARINAGIAYLQQQGYEHIVIAGWGLGAAMAISYLVENPQAPIEGLVGIAMYQLNYTDPRMWIVDTLRHLRLPIYDIYGSKDRYGSHRSAKGRRKAGELAANAQYRQMKIDDADHDFNGKESLLIDNVANWLDQQ